MIYGVKNYIVGQLVFGDYRSNDLDVFKGILDVGHYVLRKQGVVDDESLFVLDFVFRDEAFWLVDNRVTIDLFSTENFRSPTVSNFILEHPTSPVFSNFAQR